jgi:hypothetical protein
MQGMEQTAYVVEDFVREWKKVWAAMACLPNFERDIKGRLLVDICNEPDSLWMVRAGRWGAGGGGGGGREGGRGDAAAAAHARTCCSVHGWWPTCSAPAHHARTAASTAVSVRATCAARALQGWQPKNGKAGFTDLYLGAMDAIEAMTPGAAIFVVEGAGQGAYAGLNWVRAPAGSGGVRGREAGAGCRCVHAPHSLRRAHSCHPACMPVTLPTNAARAPCNQRL